LRESSGSGLAAKVMKNVSRSGAAAQRKTGQIKRTMVT
jgi:hypothetical protein